MLNAKHVFSQKTILTFTGQFVPTIIYSEAMNTEDFLKRIDLQNATLEPNIESLKMLQRNHLLNVPFENLDIRWKRKISLDLSRFYKKIVEDGRGGFCYELNGNFNELLKEIGFETKVISAKVANAMGEFGPEFDHLAIVVSFGGVEFLSDVGFGDFSAEPLRLELGLEQKDPNGVYGIEESDDGYLAVQKQSGSGWENEYCFKNIERNLSEFAAMCVHNQTSPESHFTHGKLCSLMTENGRKTLTEKKYLVTKKSEKIEMNVLTENQFYEILSVEFGILPKGDVTNG